MQFEIETYNGGAELRWGTGSNSGFIIVPDGNGATRFPHGDGWTFYMDGDNSRVETDDGTLLWHCDGRGISTTYEQAVRIAADLMSDHGENSEYDRGMIELLCDLFTVPMDDKDRVEAEMRKHKPIIPTR